MLRTPQSTASFASSSLSLPKSKDPGNVSDHTDSAKGGLQKVQGTKPPQNPRRQKEGDLSREDWIDLGWLSSLSPSSLGSTALLLSLSSLDRESILT